MHRTTMICNVLKISSVISGSAAGLLLQAHHMTRPVSSARQRRPESIIAVKAVFSGGSRWWATWPKAGQTPLAMPTGFSQDSRRGVTGILIFFRAQSTAHARTRTQTAPCSIKHVRRRSCLEIDTLIYGHRSPIPTEFLHVPFAVKRSHYSVIIHGRPLEIEQSVFS